MYLAQHMLNFYGYKEFYNWTWKKFDRFTLGKCISLCILNLNLIYKLKIYSNDNNRHISQLYDIEWNPCHGNYSSSIKYHKHYRYKFSECMTYILVVTFYLGFTPCPAFKLIGIFVTLTFPYVLLLV